MCGLGLKSEMLRREVDQSCWVTDPAAKRDPLCAVVLVKEIGEGTIEVPSVGAGHQRRTQSV